MTEVLHLGGTRLRIVREDAACLELDATYEPHGTPPPLHLHPVHEEHFEVLSGRLTVQLGDNTREYAEGEVFDVPRGVPHRMWNAGADPARVSWRNTPPMQVASMFRGISKLRDAATAHGRDRLDKLSYAALITRHRDTFRLVVAGRPWLGTVTATILGGLGRLLGR